jgi:hypothetical protein
MLVFSAASCEWMAPVTLCFHPDFTFPTQRHVFF